MSELHGSSARPERNPSAELKRRLAAMSPEKRLVLARRLAAEGKVAEMGQEPIAVIGMGCRFPGGASDPAAYWQMLSDGVHGVVEVPADRWPIDDYYDRDPEAPGKISTRSAGFIDNVSDFEPAFFDIDPAEAAAMDPQQRLLMEVTWEALEHAGISRERLKQDLTGVFIGIISHDYAYLSMGEAERITTWSGTGSSHAVAAGRISYWLDLRGPCMAIDTACSASLVAIHQACRSLLAGDCKVGLAGGVSLMLSPMTSIAATKLSKSVLAADGRCKAFDAAADGMVRGEGCGMVVLKRLSHALADGDRIMCLIRATAVNHDGRSAGLTAPNAAAQQEVMRRALSVAALDAGSVSYIEAHGTGTALGDPIEAQALKAVYGEPTGEGQPCLLGSAKTNFGHLEGAAGIAGFIKAAMCVEHGFVPPHLNFSQLSPVIDFDGTRFEIPTSGRPWTPPGRRYAGVSSFGWAGTNAHALIEQPPEPPASTTFAGAVALPLSARTPAALNAVKKRLLGYLEKAQSSETASHYDIAWTAAARRSHHAMRHCVVGASLQELIEQLRGEQAVQQTKRRPVVLLLESAAASERPDAWAQWLDPSLLPDEGDDWNAGDWVSLWEGLGIRLAALYGEGAAAASAKNLAAEVGLSWRAPTADDLVLVVGRAQLAATLVHILAAPAAEATDPRRTLLDALVQLYRAGLDVRWDRLRPRGRCIALPSYPWQRQRHWLDIDGDSGTRASCEDVVRTLKQHDDVREAIVREDDGVRSAVIQPPWRNAPGPTSVLPNGLEVTYQSAVELEHFFEDIFEKRVYAKSGIVLRPGDCVFDVGGNIGLTSLFCHFEEPDIQLWTFEPAPPLFRLLKANLDRHGANAHLFNCGISSRESTASFTFYPRSSGMSSFYADADEERDAMRAILRSRQRRGVDGIDALLAREDEYLDQRFEAETFECSLRPLSAIIDEQRVPCIDLLKIDVQKAELDVLKGISDEHWPRIRQIVIEVHDIGDRLARVSTMLRERGFEVTSEQDDSYEGSLLHNLYARRPADADPLADRTRPLAARKQPALDLPVDWPRPLAERLAAAGRPARWIARSWLSAPEVPAARRDAAAEVAALPISGVDVGDCEDHIDALVEALSQRPAPNVADVARNWQRQPASPLRKLIYAKDGVDALSQLQPLRQQLGALRRAHPDPRLGMLISGLGDQQRAMARGLYQREPVFKSWIDYAAERLQPTIDADIRQMIDSDEGAAAKPKLDLRAMLGRGGAGGGGQPSSDRLHDIRVAHPLLFAVGYALSQQWSCWGVEPAALLGYSLGEYLAATIAGVFSFEDALALVAERAALVHAVEPGAMLAVSCAAEQLTDTLGEGVWLAAVNGDDLCVIAGGREAVAQRRNSLIERGIACQAIASSHAFHTPMLQPAAERLQQVCAGLEMRAPAIPVASNVTGQWLSAEQAVDPTYWGQHLVSTVQLAAGLDTMAACNALLEIGPGRSMISLALQRAQQRERLAPRAVASLPGALDTHTDEDIMRASRAALWQHGMQLRWPGAIGRPLALMHKPVRAASIAPESPEHAPRRQPPRQWFYLPSFRRDSTATLVMARKPSLVALFADGPLADALASELRGDGARVVVIRSHQGAAGPSRQDRDHWQIRPTEPDDYAAIWRELMEDAGTQQLDVVHTWQLLAKPGETTSTIELGLHSLQTLTRSLAEASWLDANEEQPEQETVRLVVVTQAVHDVIGDEPLLPEQALALAVARCAPQEYRTIAARAVDVLLGMSHEAIAERLRCELTIASGPAVVAWRGRHRWVREMVPFQPPAEPLVPAEGAVVLITGGLGRVGRLLGRHWAERGAHVVLTTRRGFAPPEQWSELAAGKDVALANRARDLIAMQSVGGVEVCVADVTDEAAMERLLAELRQRHGRLDGVVHSAGVVGEASLMSLSQASTSKTETLLAAKVTGADVMVRLAQRHEAKWCALVSSVSSVLGGAGLCSYAAGNLYMDVLAQRSRDGSPTRVSSYCWDLFSPEAIADAGVGHDLAANAMAPEEAVTAFEQSLAASMPAHGVVSVTELVPRMLRTARPALTPVASATEQAPYVAPRNELEEMLAELWARVMKKERIGIHDNFFDLGGHSLIGAQIVAAVEQELGIVLALRQLFEHPTVAQLALALVVAMADEADDAELTDALQELGAEGTDTAGAS